MQAAGVEEGRIERIRVAARLPHVLGERASGVGPPRGLRCARRQGAERRPAADIGGAEPGAFLGADAHDADVAAGRGPALLQRGNRRQPGDHARGAVEIAAFGHRIEMRADDDRPGGAVGPRQRHIGVAGRVGLDFEAERLGRARHRAMRERLALAIARPRDADAVMGGVGELVEEACGQFSRLHVAPLLSSAPSNRYPPPGSRLSAPSAGGPSRSAAAHAAFRPHRHRDRPEHRRPLCGRDPRRPRRRRHQDREAGRRRRPVLVRREGRRTPSARFPYPQPQQALRGRGLQGGSGAPALPRARRAGGCTASQSAPRPCGVARYRSCGARGPQSAPRLLRGRRVRPGGAARLETRL